MCASAMSALSRVLSRVPSGNQPAFACQPRHAGPGWKRMRVRGYTTASGALNRRARLVRVAGRASIQPMASRMSRRRRVDCDLATGAWLGPDAHDVSTPPNMMATRVSLLGNGCRPTEYTHGATINLRADNTGMLFMPNGEVQDVIVASGVPLRALEP